MAKINPMQSLIPKIESQLSTLSVPITLQLPDGRQVAKPGSRVTLAFNEWSALAKLAGRQIGAIGEAYVEGRVQIEGAMRDLFDAAAGLLPGNPAETNTGWWSRMQRRAKSRGSHSLGKDAAQVEFHYDVSDDFYALWLDPRRVYSCAYFRDEAMTLAQAQEAKLDHICRKLMLKPGERYLDIGSGWGALLLWAAEHYGVDATGITLSKNQHAHVQRLIEEKGLQGRVRVHRVVCAVDCGRVINPTGVIQQAQGAMVYGLSAALRGNITIDRGRVAESNFHQYEPLRMNEMPDVEVHIVPSTDAPGGMGELCTPAIAPAVGNAIFAATGKRLRKMPVDQAALKLPA